MSTSRRPTSRREPEPNVTCMGMCMYGIGAGLLGVAAMTVGEKVEQYFTGRPSSLVPGRALESLLKLTPRPDSQMFSLNVLMSYTQGAVAGVARAMMSFHGIRGPIADFLFVGVRLAVDQALEVWSGVGSWPWNWPPSEQAYELLHKTVYALSTGYLVDCWLH
ncbi:uncharacterized protein CIMG_05627 [Coccidioides immitis RS]|uniref:Uncharacterized protein n=7 Tax=Coccidioides TaxID=5500 RepID=A0A0E1S407_COCIM|nr:uncharacterized protein CIMG_05627 [Coccidioides immitis RS]XP_003067791.1 hypothetical protein CPC735_067460 [Coccidioides posadasii C735 delta SOWgp]EFW17295.1 conserved hypothetical protein [Coccidioides posadasii str. Silveira]KMM71064.1 hypothetical protein CPAG_07371 [Coccidioides posadasii RMSCC 3488]KMP05772.1 hypothetical protein CIRG_05453 [Coccidioides immitis RMSCC 2394]KMU80813.1 hypothetical protein CISG_08938 [Coccidioides immitis RMSCC 3703]KMU87004.1 hypothetical protein C|eukprot:XP_003067791.1 hypothetical protein CPC735_067460 [Coccidioides posadasii C735 delta SOWgp]